MSIINEALKKAEGGKSNDKSLRDAAFARKKQKMNWGPIFVLMVLALITGPLLAPIFSSPFKNTSAPLLVPSYQEALAAKVAPSKQATSPYLQAQFGIEESVIGLSNPAAIKPAVVAPITPNYFMNGIVYSQRDSYCIINGKVVKIGETVDGAKLISVTEEKATLDLGGNQIDLWVNS